MGFPVVRTNALDVTNECGFGFGFGVVECGEEDAVGAVWVVGLFFPFTLPCEECDGGDAGELGCGLLVVPLTDRVDSDGGGPLCEVACCGGPVAGGVGEWEEGDESFDGLGVCAWRVVCRQCVWRLYWRLGDAFTWHLGVSWHG